MNMGVQVTPEMLRLMNELDQRTYGPGIHPLDDPHPAPKTDKLEREEQRQFASWLMLNGFDGRVWHKTNVASTASPGCPDFIVPVNGITLWIEFKRAGYDLSPDQEKFRLALEKQGIRLYVVYSAFEAIELMRFFMPISVLDKQS